MDDSANQTQNPNDSVVSQQPQVPVSSPHKEAAPLTNQSGEYLRTEETKPELSHEVTEAGVDHSPEEKPQIPNEAVQAGMSHAKETVSHPTEPTGVVQLPHISQQQALLMKKNPIKDAARWLAVLVLRQFDKIAYQKMPVKK